MAAGAVVPRALGAAAVAVFTVLRVVVALCASMAGVAVMIGGSSGSGPVPVGAARGNRASGYPDPSGFGPFVHMRVPVSRLTYASDPGHMAAPPVGVRVRGGGAYALARARRGR
ncbi:hypothetical protein GCM10010368_22560 [Streptomyces roseiscleroticus]|uniref:Secreted protein n=1 Tax=Streptomyces roseiscleroticus TaxID=1972 RepID=A0ABN3EDD1_9ACTN